MQYRHVTLLYYNSLNMEIQSSSCRQHRRPTSNSTLELWCYHRIGMPDRPIPKLMQRGGKRPSTQGRFPVVFFWDINCWLDFWQIVLYRLTFPSTMTALTMGARKPMVLETVLRTPRRDPVWLGARSVMANCTQRRTNQGIQIEQHR